MIEVERAQARDAPDIAPLFDAYRSFFTAGRDLATSARFLSERLASAESVVYGARADGRWRGFAQLYPLWSSWYCARIWFLSDLSVAEDARGRGLGRLLVERVKAHAHETGASSVMVELPRSEPHLQAFYSSLGFAEDDVFGRARYRLPGV